MSQGLLVIRHLETEDNLTNRFCSGDRDVPIIAGQAINSHIMEELPRKIDYILADTGLQRSRQTRQLLQTALGYKGEVVILPEFKERIGGELAGLLFSEIQQFFPCLKVPNELWRIKAPGLGLENAEDFLFRIERGIERIQNIGKSVVLVGHAGSIKGIKAVLTAKTVEERIKILYNPTPKHTNIYVFSIERKED